MDTYREILAHNADSAEADMLAAEAADEMKDNETAIKQFRAVIAANPKEPNTHFGLGYLLWSLKQYPEAMEQFQAELDNDPKHERAMEYLAGTHLQANQMDAARPLLEKVANLNPALPLAHLDLGIIYSQADLKPQALREPLTAEKLDPQDVNVHWRLGRLYRTMGQKEEAQTEFDKSSALYKEKDDENFRRIAEANARHGDAPAQQPARVVTAPNQ